MEINKVYIPILTAERTRLAHLFRKIVQDRIETAPENNSGKKWLEHVLELTKGVADGELPRLNRCAI